MLSGIDLFQVAGDRMRYWGKAGAFWGGIFALLFGSGGGLGWSAATPAAADRGRLAVAAAASATTATATTAATAPATAAPAAGDLDVG